MSQSQPARTSDAGLSALFDLSFNRFVTVGIIKFVYILAMVGLALAWLALVLVGFNNGGFVAGVAAAVVGTVGAALYLLLIRMGLEFVVVVFRIGRNTERLAQGPEPTGGFPVGPVA